MTCTDDTDCTGAKMYCLSGICKCFYTARLNSSGDCVRSCSAYGGNFTYHSGLYTTECSTQYSGFPDVHFCFSTCLNSSNCTAVILDFRLDSGAVVCEPESCYLIYCDPIVYSSSYATKLFRRDCA